MRQNPYYKNIILILMWLIVISIAGCGEIVHNKYLIPEENDLWQIYQTKDYNHEDAYTTQCIIDGYKIRIYIEPLLQDQIAVGPLVPIFPNFLDNGVYCENCIIVHVSVVPPPPENNIKEIYIKADDTTVFPSDVKSFYYRTHDGAFARYEIRFDTSLGNISSIKLFFPNLGLKNFPGSLNYKFNDETKYRMSPPRGMFQ